jgi:hypothetical protein
MSVNEKMKAIADAIRNVTGGTEPLTLDDMASGINDVYEAGKQSQHDEFWDSFQSNGTRTDYTRTFCSTTWNNTTFKPKHQIKPKIAQLMFYRNTALTGEIEAITNIDWSECTNFEQACQDLSKVTRLGVIDLRKATNLTNAFIYMTELTTIDKIIFGDSTPNITFAQDTSLENIKTEGVISNDIAFKNSPLSVESLKSIISCLKDYTGTTSEYTKKVTFLTSAFDVLESEGNTSPNGNSWAEYIDDLKWNLVKG